MEDTHGYIVVVVVVIMWYGWAVASPTSQRLLLGRPHWVACKGQETTEREMVEGG